MTAKRDVLLVTGGSRGIGAATVRRAVAQGYAVAYSYATDRAAAENLRMACRENQVICIQGDVRDPEFAERFIEAAHAQFGPITALVNNAGTTGPIGPFCGTQIESLRLVLDTNVLGTMVMARAAVRYWKEGQSTGRIVNVSSAAASLGAANEYVHYAASKAAVEAFTVGLGKEVAPLGIRVNAVAPGTTATGIHAAAGDSGRLNRIASTTPMGRVAAADEIAAAILWLLSAEASYVTGTVLRVSGGL